MDPITGIGLAASVVQLVQFGVTTARTCYEFYEKGSTEDLDSLDYTAKHLTSLSISLERSMQDVHDDSALSSQDERQLMDVARRSQECSSKLQHELQKLQGRSRGSKTETVHKTIRAGFKRRTINKLQQQLQESSSLLEKSLLHRLRLVADSSAWCTST